MIDKIDCLKLGFENLRIGLVVPSIGLGAVSVEAGMTWSSCTGLSRYFEPYHSFPPCCHAPSLTTSPPALPFKAPHGHWRLSHPQPFTHAKTTMVNQHGCHLHPPWPSFHAVEGEITCRETQKTGEENTENNSSLNSEENNQNNFFLFSKKRPLENMGNTKNKNHPLSQIRFQCFLFSRTENGFENNNQTNPKILSFLSEDIN